MTFDPLRDARYVYWDADAQVVKTSWITIDTYNKPTVDRAHDDPEYRYGNFEYEKYKSCDWIPIPLEKFPSEFKAQLLLLGIQ